MTEHDNRIFCQAMASLSWEEDFITVLRVSPSPLATRATKVIPRPAKGRLRRRRGRLQSSQSVEGSDWNEAVLLRVKRARWFE